MQVVASAPPLCRRFGHSQIIDSDRVVATVNAFLTVDYSLNHVINETDQRGVGSNELRRATPRSITVLVHPPLGAS
jgi:hypothetical protein